MKRKCTKAAWQDKFVCLAYQDQEKIPETDFEKEELYQAGLGEKTIEFESMNMSSKEFKDHLVKSFPKLDHCGGFQLLKGI